jgi:hypothetical protein
VICASVGLQRFKRCEIIRFRHGELSGPITDHPQECVLNEVNMMQTISNGSVVSCRWMRPDCAPVLRISPSLMSVQIEKQRIHIASIRSARNLDARREAAWRSYRGASTQKRQTHRLFNYS